MIQQLSDIGHSDQAIRNRLRGAGRRVPDAIGIRSYMGSVLGPHQFELSGGCSGSVDLWHASVDLGGVALHYLDYQSGAENATVVVDEPQDAILLKFPLSGPTRVRTADRDFLVHPNEFGVIRADKPFSTVMQGDNCHLTLAIDTSWIVKFLAEHDLPLRAHTLSFDSVAHGAETDGHLLAGVVSTLVSSLSRQDPALCLHGVATHLKHLLTSAVLGLSPEYRQACQALTAPEFAPDYILRAESYMKEHLDEPIGMDDIVRYSGRTRRTLHAGFRRHRGTTPMVLLKSMRLRAVKFALENPSLDDNPVTSIAMTYGFYHLGRFSQEFKGAYGVLPSEVRRRHR